MGAGDHSEIQPPGHEAVHVCHKCGWPFPNPHPSARHRRAHKKVCGTLEGYILVDSNDSDYESHSDEDRKTPSLGFLKRSISEKGSGGIGERSNRSEDEVFTDAAAEFSDSSGFSPGVEERFVDARKSISNMERIPSDDSSSNQSVKDIAISDIIQPASSSTDSHQKKNHEVSDRTTDQLESTFQYEVDMPTATSHTAEESDIVLSIDSNSLLRDSYPIQYEKSTDSTLHESETKAGEIVTESPSKVLEQDNCSRGSPETKLDNISEYIVIEGSPTEMTEVAPELKEAKEQDVLSADGVFQSKEESLEGLNPKMSTSDSHAGMGPVEYSDASFDAVQISVGAAQATDSSNSHSMGDDDDEKEGNGSVHMLSVPSDVYMDNPEVMLEGFKGHKGLKLHQPVPSNSCERIEDKEADIKGSGVTCSALPVLEDKLDDGSCKFMAKEVTFEGEGNLPETVLSDNENSQSDVGFPTYAPTVEMKNSYAVPFSKEEIPRDIFRDSLQKSSSDVATEVVPDVNFLETSMDAKVNEITNLVDMAEGGNHGKGRNELDMAGPDIASEVVPDVNFVETSTDAKVNDITNLVDMAEAGSYGKGINEELDMAETGNSKVVSEDCAENTVKDQESPSNISEFQVNSLLNSSAGNQDHYKDKKHDISENGGSGVPSEENVSITTKSVHEASCNLNGSQFAAVDVTDGSNDNISEIGYTQMDTVSDPSRAGTGVSTIQEPKEDKVNASNTVQEECVDEASMPTESHHGKDVKIFQKASEYHIMEERVVSPRTSAAVEENDLREIVEVASRTGSETLQAGDNNITTLNCAAADISIDSCSQNDSLEAHWGSVSVLSTQSDVPTIIDAESLPYTDSLAPTGAADTGNLSKLKVEPQGQCPDKSDVCEPPSFSTLVETGQKADGSDIQAQQSKSAASASQAGWFPSLTNVVNDSPGRKKNEEIIAKVTNWSSGDTGKQHMPMKTLKSEASLETTKPKSPSPKESPIPVTEKDDTATAKGNGNDAQATTVNSILSAESPAAQTTTETGKEWSSPTTKYPSDIKREKRKDKGRPLWAPFVCCYSVNSVN